MTHETGHSNLSYTFGSTSLWLRTQINSKVLLQTEYSGTSRDKVLRPERLEVDPNSSEASCEWLHWKKTFDNFLNALPSEGLDKLGVLVNFISPRIFQYIEKAESYDTAIEILKTIKHCNFKAVSAVQNRDAYVRDAFIRGLNSTWIRQRLLENKHLDLNTTYDQARSLEVAIKNAEVYRVSDSSTVSAAAQNSETQNDETSCDIEKISATANTACFFCGGTKHPRSKCPARNVFCFKCHKKGHFIKVCRGTVFNPQKPDEVTACSNSYILGMAFDNTPKSLRGSSSVIHIEGHEVRALFDSCSSQSFIHPRLIERCNLPIKRDTVRDKVAMASLACSMPIKGCTAADIEYQGRHYPKFNLRVMNDLCCDILLGIDFQGQHQSVTYNYGGDRPPMSVCGFSTFKSLPPEPFKNLTADCHPIATKSRWYSKDDRKFIEMEVNRLLQEGIVTPSRYPWRAQGVVVKGENGKRSTVDLKSAYHQVPLEKEDQKYTAFEAAGALFQFTRLPFGVAKGEVTNTCR
uniref:uncharacterized protein LOC120330077 n=1 Tax=Styela clava TaxID=7725 RepID=UPI00193989BE|nr:uncharacterized protein LOC120330077 [Styela clava]